MAPPRILSQSAELMSRYVLPLYFDDEHGRPTQVGSAFIVSFQSSDYLVTAAHVLDLRAKGDLYFFSAYKTTVLIEGRACVSGKGLDRSEDQIDVAVTRLALGTPRPPYVDIERSAFETYQLLPRMRPRSGRIFCLMGYPSSKNEFRRAHGEVRAKAYGFYGSSADEEKYHALGLPLENHLLLRFDRKSGFNDQAQPVIFPKPQGMSGGPIWQFNSANRDDFRFGFPVVGIAVAHKERDTVVQGTDITIALQFIGDLHAETAALSRLVPRPPHDAYPRRWGSVGPP